MRPQLFPRLPRRMKQPSKELLREQLALAATHIEQVRLENVELRENGCRPVAELASLATELAEAAAALGHHQTLRSSSEETIDYWRREVDRLRAAITGASA